MSVISIKRVPFAWTINQLEQRLQAKCIKGPFEVLNLSNGKGGKCGYVQLSEFLDPLVVIEDINRANFKNAKLFASMPNKIPDLPLPQSHIKKLKAATAPPEPPEKTLLATHSELVTELQYKYPGLQYISYKTQHRLLCQISKIIFERLKDVMDTDMEYAKTPFILSKSYRKSYPHFADFQLVLSTLHSLEDAAGAPRTQLSEEQLTANDETELNNIPIEKVQKTCHKYADRIRQKMVEHINNLKTDPETESPTSQELARFRVRRELKKVSPYVGHILKQVISANLLQNKQIGANKMIRMRIYGEPFLPTRDHLEPLMRRVDARRIVRADRIYNMVTFTTTQRHYRNVMAYHHTQLGGAKLIISKADLKIFKQPREERDKMLRAVFPHHNVNMTEPDNYDENMEDWDQEM